MNLPNPSTCSNCVAPAQEARGIYRFQESGLSNVFLVNIGLIRCSQCGNEDPIIPHLNELMTKIALAVVKKPCTLNGSEVRFIRKFLNMTGDKFGSYLGVGKHTISKWENNDDPVGPQSDRLIRALTVCLGENLREHRNEVAQAFPGIEETIREIDYKIDPEADERTGTVVLRALSHEDARQEILDLFRVSGDIPLFYSDIAERLQMDLEQVLLITTELEREGLIGEVPGNDPWKPN